MDGTRALFKKIKGRDRQSFDALSESYGWKLYSHIRNHTEDRAEADRIFNETFSLFYDALEDYEGDDPIEAMLFFCADRAGCRKNSDGEADMGQWEIGHEAGFQLPQVDPKVYEKRKEPLWLRIFYSVCIVLLIFGILAAVWIMVYMLMSMNLIPSADLGYSWFNAHIADLF